MFGLKGIYVVEERADFGRLASRLVLSGQWRILRLDALHKDTLAQARLLVFDCDLQSPQTLGRLRELTARLPSRRPDIAFVLETASHRETIQAEALGARHLVARGETIERQAAILEAILGEAGSLERGAIEPVLARGIAAGSDALDQVFTQVRLGQAIATEALSHREAAVLDAVAAVGLSGWIGAVREHHGQTFRHCMLVTGVAADFARRLGLASADQHRMLRGAMLHDIGKAAIPLAILDKAGPLTEAERAQMRVHPAIGYKMLEGQAGISDEIRDIVLHHHEKLDGSGYPDGLRGGQIADIVQLVTIADVFSAFIEPRAYKPEMSPAEAFAFMGDLKGAFDRALLSAFEPVVHSLAGGIARRDAA